MHRHRIRHLPVVDTAGRLEGIVTDRDLRHYLLSPAVLPSLGREPVAGHLKKARVQDVMTRPVFVTAPETDLKDAVSVMRERRVGALPVLEGRRLVGIITETDLLRRIVAAEPTATGTPEDDSTAAIIVSYP